MAAIDDGLASWLPSKMEFSLTQAYSVPEVSAPRSTTTFPDPLTRLLPSTWMESTVDFADRAAEEPVLTGAATDTDGVPTSTSTVATAVATAVTHTIARRWLAPRMLVTVRPDTP